MESKELSWTSVDRERRERRGGAGSGEREREGGGKEGWGERGGGRERALEKESVGRLLELWTKGRPACTHRGVSDVEPWFPPASFVK